MISLDYWQQREKRTYESPNMEWKNQKWEKFPKHYAYKLEVAYA
jgi:hypothetical protein